MKKLVSVLLSAVLLLSQVTLVASAKTVTGGMMTGSMISEDMTKKPIPKMISGTIQEENATSILVKPYGTGPSVILKITDDTCILNSTTGDSIELKNRIDDSIIAYHGPEETKSMPAQSNAVVILCSLPQDYSPPTYAVVEAVEKKQGNVKITIMNGSIIANIINSVPINQSMSKGMANGMAKDISIDNIAVGSKLLLWYDTVTMSMPGYATVTKVVVLGMDDMNSTKETTTKDMSASNMTSGLPDFKTVSDKEFSKKLMAIVSKVEKTGKEASKGGSVKYSYQTINSGKYTSVIIHTVATKGNTSGDMVQTIVYDKAAKKILKLQDCLGVNAYKLANMAISKKIASAPEGSYFTEDNGFDGIKSEPNFYIDAKGNVVIIFDKYSIAPGSAGIPTFVINPTSILTHEMPTNKVMVKGYTTMVPLNEIAQIYGYKLSLDQKTNIVTMTKGTEKHTITINKNKYDGKELELMPIVKDSKTYVPLSFFEVILDGCYTSYESKVVFSMFK